MIGQIELNRRLAAQEVALRNEDPAEVRVVARTPAYARSKPRVSVLIPLYNHAEEVGSALESVAASELESLEVVVLDDASTDRSQEAVLDFFAEHSHLPGMLLQHVVNRGLGRTRNDLVAAARGELVFMLDADNEIYPTALDRLVEALDDDSGAFFAYPMLEEHVDGEPDTLRSYLPWEPGQLAESNYIDAMSLLRRQELVELGGYTRGPAPARVGGLRPLVPDRASAACAAFSCPEILARYRRAAHSMLYSITNIDTSEAQTLLATRYPSLADARLTIAIRRSGEACLAPPITDRSR